MVRCVELEFWLAVVRGPYVSMPVWEKKIIQPLPIFVYADSRESIMRTYRRERMLPVLHRSQHSHISRRSRERDWV